MAIKQNPSIKTRKPPKYEVLPYPAPRNAFETSQNLRYFRDCADITQEEAAERIGVCTSTYGTWETKKGQITPCYLTKAATVLNCDVDLINAACPNLYIGKYKTYPPIKIGRQIVFCFEPPLTKQEVGNNLKYFIALSGYTEAELSEECDFAPGILQKWKQGKGLKELRANEVASKLNCPAGLIYLPKKRTSINGKQDETDAFYKKPKDLNQLKANLRHYIAASALSYQEIARRAGIQTHTLRNAVDSSKGSFLESEESKAIASVLGFSASDILISSIKSRKKVNHVLKSNVARMYETFPELGILDVKIGVYASGGDPCEMPSSQIDETVASSMSLTPKSKIHGVSVMGDSMFNFETGQGIQNGFIVLVDADRRDIEQAIGKVVCIRLDGNELIVKRLERKGGVLYACSDNPAYIPHALPIPENAELLGVCVGVYSPIC